MRRRSPTRTSSSGAPAMGSPAAPAIRKIGADVNGLARDGDSISLRNPVALYITGWDSSGMKKPDGSPVGNYWKLLRGEPAPGPNEAAMGLHLVFEVPAPEGFVVGDIKIGNRTIQYGGQLAEKITVGLFGLVCNEGQSNNPSFKCGVQPQAHPAAPALGLAPEAPAIKLPTRSRQGRFEDQRCQTKPEDPAAEKLATAMRSRGTSWPVSTRTTRSSCSSGSRGTAAGLPARRPSPRSRPGSGRSLRRSARSARSTVSMSCSAPCGRGWAVIPTGSRRPG